MGSDNRLLLGPLSHRKGVSCFCSWGWAANNPPLFPIAELLTKARRAPVLSQNAHSLGCVFFQPLICIVPCRCKAQECVLSYRLVEYPWKALPFYQHTFPDLPHLICLTFRVEHARMHAKHRGHEAMHAEMVLILIATLVVAQLLLVQWKQRHPRSYNVSHCLSLLFLTVVKRPFLSILGSSLTQAAYRQGIDNDSKRYV